MAQVIPPFEDIAKFRQPATPGELHLLHWLEAQFDAGTQVFFQPCINGERPDIVLMHRKHGVLIVEVKDWDLAHYCVDADNRWSLCRSAHPYALSSPVAQAFHYKQTFFKLHVNGLLERAATGSTQVTISGGVADDPTYANPALATTSTLAGGTRAWAMAPQDDISRLMTRNENDNTSVRDLATLWRGLGGALLTRLQTTQSDYQQTVVDYEARMANMVQDQAAGISYWNVGMGETRTSRIQALSAVQNGETQVDLSIKTRS